MNMYYLKPAAGRAVPDPGRNDEWLPEAGDWLPRDAYWQRRLRDGDVIAAEPPYSQVDAPLPPEPVVEAIAEPAPIKTLPKGVKPNGRKLQ